MVYSLVQAGQNFGETVKTTNKFFAPLKSIGSLFGDIFSGAVDVVKDIPGTFFGGVQSARDAILRNFNNQSLLNQVQNQRADTPTRLGGGPETTGIDGQIISRDVLTIALVAGGVVVLTLLFKRG